MSTTSPQPVIHLADYRPYPWRIDRVALTFRLNPTATEVLARLRLSPLEPGQPLVLDGEALDLVAARIDDRKLGRADYHLTDRALTIHPAALPEGDFTLETLVRIDPAANTALSGLYLSNGIYCTQCEAEGFRRITFYPDRPDVMAPFRVRIESDLPVLLSNGNPVDQGAGFAEWHDPWPKPAYLFALVAGDLRATRGAFKTRSGRDVDLAVWVRPGDEGRTDWALDSLIRSMKWDEAAYGREYDLDVFNIVAVDDFNMGAMENKGLNIFNAARVLAAPETETDADFERIEAIIAHEYFHNWTGNRITCRDWFQLCLKEGLTVFRDQQFTGDLRSHPVKRIEDVATLRARQFREDAGPLAHPPRPDHFVEINNFYTATVYEKGAEIVGMLRRLVGPAGYRAALDLYFARHDGQACTVEQWLQVFADTSGRDLAQFMRWYTDAGTPHLHLTEDWDGSHLTLTFRQETAPTPGQPEKPARHIPVAIGLLNPNGDEVLPTTLCEVTQDKQSFRFGPYPARPTASVLRDFSAPVVLHREPDPARTAFLLAHDTDPFNRWQAGRDLALAVLVDRQDPRDLIDGLGRLIVDDSLDPAFRALCLALPPEDEIAASLHAAGRTPDPDAIQSDRRALARAIATAHQDALAAIYDQMATPGPYSPQAEPAGRRALRLAALSLLTPLDGGTRARALYAQADNMTERLAALTALVRADAAQAELADFATRYGSDRLAMNKWFTVQVAHAPADRAAQIARALTERPDFDWKNPNRFRAVMGGLLANHAGFHHASGAGYDFYADWLIRLDPVNPQTTARMTAGFETWPRYDTTRQTRARAAMTRLQAAPGLSPDTQEMVDRILGS
ncbi:aminopeptidase N [Paracoccus sp. p3-h83]|uniref:aminopeptidase N n=1 Tax=Paracoccus sp. p3-h83 TaxID=3342805 RepID=UPI0035B9FA74